MILFPAVDIKDGKVVRLKQGKKDQVTIFEENPLIAADGWIKKGAKWLHIVDLDGAFDGQSENVKIIEQICNKYDINIQVGGGIRDIAAAQKYLDAGASRLIIGTVALEDKKLFQNICEKFPGRIGVSLDAENGFLKTRGWVQDSQIKVLDILPQLDGTSFIIYTDIEKDGTHGGVNLKGLTEILRSTQIPVIAAGGISSMADINAVANLKDFGNLEGIISGRALYDGTLDFSEAQKWLDSINYSALPLKICKRS